MTGGTDSVSNPVSARCQAFFVGFAVSLVIATSAHAQSAAASSLTLLRLPGAETCISEEELRAAVERRIGRPLARVSSATRKVVGIIEYQRALGGYRAKLNVEDAEGFVGEREFSVSGTDCRELDQALVLAVMLAVNPDATRDVPRRLPPQPARTMQAEPTEPTPDPKTFGAQFGFVLGGGFLLGVSWGERLGAFAELSPGWEARVAVTRWRDARIPGERSATLELTQAEATACRTAEVSRFRFGVCPRLSIGSLSAKGIGLVSPNRDSGAVVHAGAGGFASMNVAGPMQVGTSSFVLASLTRQSVVFQDRSGRDRELYFTPGAAIAFELFLTLRFPL